MRNPVGGRGTYPRPPGLKFPTTRPATRLGSQFLPIPVTRMRSGYPLGDPPPHNKRETKSLAWIYSGNGGELELGAPSSGGGGLKLPAPTTNATTSRGRDSRARAGASSVKQSSWNREGQRGRGVECQRRALHARRRAGARRPFFRRWRAQVPGSNQRCH